MKKYIMAVMVLFMVVLCGGCGKEEDAEAVNITFVLGMASGESKIKENLTETENEELDDEDIFGNDVF